MGLLTLLAVSLLGSAGAAADQDQGEGVSQASEVEQAVVRGLVVDTSAALSPLRLRPGSLDPEKVREIVSSQQPAIRSCYQRAVLETPSLAGRCTVHIVVAGDGAVGSASLQGSTVRSLSLGRCLLQLVRTWRFPAPADGKAVAVDYPLVFRREEPDAGS